MVDQPSGIVTFLFTDLEGSTPLWEEHPDAMRVALARHDEILRSAVEAQRGAVVKTTGDGLYAAFATASEAVGAAAAAQHALMGERWPLPEPLRVRMGLHTGHVEAWGDDYYGPTVNRAARVTSVANPGQILVSAATAAPLEGWALRDLGEHRLRGLPPMRLYQVMAPGLAVDFPPLATASVAVDLPSPPTTLVGRHAEVDVVGKLVGEHRVVTLTGVGGCGKTRLGIEAGRRFAGRFPDGVRFVDLAAVSDPIRVPDAVVQALGLADDPAVADPVARLGTYVAGRELLCVLDNCEHVLDACGRLAEAILSYPGPSRLLATSREPLGVVGEQIYVVPSLDADTDGVRLFADRAAEARAGFTVGHANRDAIAQICRRLDGIPLAIELAAARVAHLSPAQLLDRLDDRFRLLTGGQRRVKRHQTLSATLEWSHDLLQPQEQAVLRRLAIFPASFSLDAAQDVASVGDVVQPLGSLVAKSLVQVVDDADQMRYRLLETVRLYAETKLIGAGEARESHARHRDFVLDWLESIPLEERLLGDTDVLVGEQANIRAALEWSASEGDFDALARIAAGVDWSHGRYFMARGDVWQEGLRWCEAASTAVETLSPEVQAQLYLMIFRLTRITLGESSDWAGRNDWSQRAIDACGGIPSPLLAEALTSRGLGAAVVATELRDESLATRATEWTEAGVAMIEQFPQPWRSYCRMLAGQTYASLNLTLSRIPDRAGEHFAAAVAAAPRSPPYLALHARACCYLALHKAVTGDVQGATALAREARADGVLELLGREDPLALALAVTLPSTAPRKLPPKWVIDSDDALAELRAYDEAARRADWGLGVETVVLYGGILAALRQDWETASRLLAAGERSIYRATYSGQLYFTFRDRVRAALGPERSRQLRDEGRAMSLADAREAALQ
jgi:predicted ATPase/class 3 adenylate cyclase